MRIALIFRKKNEQFFSIERVFEQVISNFGEEVEYVRIEMPVKGISLRNIFAILKLRFSKKFDLYHITGDSHYLSLFLPSDKVVLTIHDCIFLNKKGFKGLLLKKLLLDWPVYHTKHITTVSDKSKKEITYYANCQEDKIRVIRNPINRHIHFIPRKFDNSCPHFLFLGSTANKNFERTIDALRGLNFFLTLVGNYSKEQIEILHNYSISHIIKSNLTDLQIASEYAAADVVLFPSLYEGFGLPIIEGFKAGRIVVTSNLSPMKELSDGAAILIDPTDVNSIRDGILKAVNDEVSRTKLIEKGFEVVLQYDAKLVSADYIKVYKEAISKTLCVE